MSNYLWIIILFRVPFDFDIGTEPMLGLKLSPIYQKMDTYFFGQLVRSIISFDDFIVRDTHRLKT